MKEISRNDRTILRRLAAEWAEVASLSVQRQRADCWRRMNNLERVKPMVWINEIPWHEMNVDDELTLCTTDPLCRQVEDEMRRTLYQWRHLPGDMIIESVFYSALVVHDTGFEIDELVDIVKTDEASSIVSRHFHPQIETEADLEKIKMPVVGHDAVATETNYSRLVDAFGDILPVEKRGQPGFWFAPWDLLIRWWGVEQAMMDLVLRPELVHHAMDRLTQAYMTRLDQYEAQNLLARNDNNTRIGSGGYGYCDDLPQRDFDPARPRALDLWGCGTAQIFSDVSPAMHEEFALQYERRWMERFGLTYYGCCEPLHLKIDMLQSVPNLRKISMSPWVDLNVAAQKMQDRYVFSYKPSPAPFAEDTWRPERMRQDLRQALEVIHECRVEVIMKDISTVRYAPQRLWEWVQIAVEETERWG